MANERITVEAELTVDGAPLRVIVCRLSDGLSRVPEVHCECTGDDDTPAPEKLIGKPAKLTLQTTEHGTPRHFVGLVVEAERSHEDAANFRLFLTLAPRLWKLSRRRDCRTFQNQKVPDIVRKVLDDAGVSDQKWSLTDSYNPRLYVVQYRESDLDFVLRLLSEEGIAFAHDFSGEVDKVVFYDDKSGYEDVEGHKSLVYRHAFGAMDMGDYVTRVRRTRRIRPDKVTTRDFDFEKPRAVPEDKAEGKTSALEVYEWPGRFTQKSVATVRAKKLLEALRADHDVVFGEAAVLSLVPGRRFEIEGHPYGKLNAEYQVVECTIELEDERWKEHGDGAEERSLLVRFTAIPTAIAYRPPRRLPQRTVPGLQTAKTTGASGEEIHVDKHGRVKVLFPWDRKGKTDDTSSDWIRTCQLPTGGAMYLPRVGWEASVDFIEGDIDRPFVFQRFYNGVSRPPYALPANKARSSVQTATTPGGGSSNEFRFDDTKGKEQMFFNGSKDMSVDVKNNATEAVKNNEEREIGANHKLEVSNSVSDTIGAKETVQVSGNQDVHVQTFHTDEVGGSHSLSIGGNRKMMIGADHKHEIASDSTITVGSMKTDLVVGAVSESTPGSFSHSVGAALVEMTTGTRSITVGASHTESIGVAKVIVAGAARTVDVGAAHTIMIGGAAIYKVGGDRGDNADGMFTEVAAGAQISKAGGNVTFEAKGLLSIVMGASTLLVTPAAVILAGVSLKLDGAVVDTGIVIDN